MGCDRMPSSARGEGEGGGVYSTATENRVDRVADFRQDHHQVSHASDNQSDKAVYFSQ